MIDDFKYKEIKELRIQFTYFIGGGDDERFQAKEIQILGLNK